MGDRLSHAIQSLLWRQGFGHDTPDGIGVAEPLGWITELAMWLQRELAGAPLIEHLGDTGAVALVPRIAAAIHKLHGAEVMREPLQDRRQTMEDEPLILRAGLDAVAATHPAWAARLARERAACGRLGRQGLLI